ncbi:homeobox and c2h2 transcription factor [Diplodia corticola]|uniref:Homeobox and c2h2 transcription factor n=1 Tax=Diplodia corticola TaxID=236234 RepID=A0A1J9QMU4_9PEZI|nr:homeobox and c2h2 transcription factor [Diplodia corticola]OJD29793.1 homeobox and c2h2 transcription factor [Diplodia corticola]
MVFDNRAQSMDDLFDFGEAAMPDLPTSNDHTNLDPQPTAPFVGTCLLHPHDDGCPCNGRSTSQVVDVSEPLVQQPTDYLATNDLNNDWTMNFSNFISRYHKPENSCDYCRLRHLDCFLTFEGQTGCSPCNALFRTCSFDIPAQQRKPRNMIDTLHQVSEDVCQEFGALTSTKTMVGIKTDEDRAARKGGIRFSRASIKILTDWIVSHSDHPYPTEDEKADLRQRTGLTESQVNNWLANARRRKKHKPKRPASPSMHSSEAMDIALEKSWSEKNPMERYLESPPDNEPAPWTAIQKAVRTTTPPPDEERSRSGHTSRHASTGSSGHLSRRAPSTNSMEIASVNSGLSSQAESLGSVWSYTSRNSRNSGNSFGSFGSFGSVNGVRKERRRRRRPDIKKQASEKDKKTKLFQCTFCTDAFKSKYDWARHEKSLHLSLEKWICAPLGPVITCSASGQKKCVFCDDIEPSKEHLETHNWSACEERSPEQRTFYRKDHLRQHMRLMHNCKMTETMESWKSETQYIKSRCGFCRMTFETWQDRADHLAKEFRNGAQMKDWKGCRGFDPQVALLITNAMPPYLIANEAKSPNPFSASQPASLAWHTTHHPTMAPPNRWDQAAVGGFFHADRDGPPVPGLRGNATSDSSLSTPQEHGMRVEQGTINATCWEILTVRLGRYAKQQLSQGMCPTDAMLQREARRILYDADDGWEQTAADNAEWLELFKKAHGLVGVGQDFDARDTLEDLGMLGDVASYPFAADDWTADYAAPTCSDSMGGLLNLCHANMMLGGPATATTGISTATTEGIFDMEGLQGLEALSSLSVDSEPNRRQTWNGFPGIVSDSGP